MSGRRWFIFVPEINPRTFVFFFYRGNSGRSWSVRDYSSGIPVLHRANEFPWTATQVLEMAGCEGSHATPAEIHPTEDIAWYLAQIQKLNGQYLGDGPGMIQPAPRAAQATPKSEFPMLDIATLLTHSKSRKTHDLRRMYESPQSEDWVTWTFLRALQRRRSHDWWPDLVEVVRSTPDPPAEVPPSDQSPTAGLWRAVASPPAYQAASRLRMASSTNPEWVARAENSAAVEGSTEVDLVFDGETYLVFVEAKLNSDISERTTYDPERNQIARNIDCVVEEAGDRTPFFWMLVKDRAPRRMYSRVLDTYRRDPNELRRLLPHRSNAELQAVAASIATITWRELYPLLPDEPDTVEALAELLRRI